MRISAIKAPYLDNLTKFCDDSKLVLSSKLLLPADSYTYIREAWYTTSWLDHCVCTADARDCTENTEVLYDVATTDHIPVSMTLNVKSLPEL